MEYLYKRLILKIQRNVYTPIKVHDGTICEEELTYPYNCEVSIATAFARIDIHRFELPPVMLHIFSFPYLNALLRQIFSHNL